MTDCNSTDFVYPMLADIYTPTITQGEYGQIQKAWTLDQTAVCNATSVGGAGKEDIRPEVFIQHQGELIARMKIDPRYLSDSSEVATTNILITNIRSCYGEVLYKETSGPRSGSGTIYEIATLEPFINPFGQIEYYKMLWRRTETQAIGA